GASVRCSAVGPCQRPPDPPSADRPETGPRVASGGPSGILPVSRHRGARTRERCGRYARGRRRSYGSTLMVVVRKASAGAFGFTRTDFAGIPAFTFHARTSRVAT